MWHYCTPCKLYIENLTSKIIIVCKWVLDSFAIIRPHCHFQLEVFNVLLTKYKVINLMSKIFYVLYFRHYCLWPFLLLLHRAGHAHPHAFMRNHTHASPPTVSLTHAQSHSFSNHRFFYLSFKIAVSLKLKIHH